VVVVVAGHQLAVPEARNTQPMVAPPAFTGSTDGDWVEFSGRRMEPLAAEEEPEEA